MSVAVKAIGVRPIAGIHARRAPGVGVRYGQSVGYRASRTTSTASIWDGGVGAGGAEAVQACTTWLSNAGVSIQNQVADLSASDFQPEYAKTSFYTALGLYLISFPGLYSLVKRSTKPKIVRKSYTTQGPKNSGKALNAIARDIATFFLENNYRVAKADDTILFEGATEPSRGQAAFLVFCTFIGLGSFALVLSILYQDIGDKFYLMTLVSPFAGVYYWANAVRKEEAEVKMLTSDDDMETEITVQGPEEVVESFRRELRLAEKGKVYVKGILEN